MAMNYVIEKEKPDFEVRTDLALEGKFRGFLFGNGRKNPVR